MTTLEIVTIAFAGALLYLLWRLAKGPSAHLPYGAKLPPVLGGLPWIGCAREFGKEPLWCIGKSYNKFGDIFTIVVAGKWMTFLLNPKYYQHFFASESVDFKAAVFPVVNKVAGVQGDVFFKYHWACHKALKGHFSSTTAVLCPIMSSEFFSSLNAHGEGGEKEMYDFVQEAMFEAVTKELFGRDNVPKNKAGMLHMMNAFRQYDEQFEYGAEVPEILLRKWRNSKYKLLKLFWDAVCGRPDSVKNLKEKGVVMDVLSPIVVSNNIIPNFLLVMFWAAHGNVTPVAYWTLCHIFSERELHKSAMEDTHHINLFNEDGNFVPIEEEELKKCCFTKRCVMESARMHAPGAIVRKVIKTHTIQDYTIPAGHMMLLSPYWSHRNPKYFPEPDTFKPERWLECDLDHHQFLKGFIPFGGGRYQCPGKMFALMEMHLFVVMVLKMFDIEMLDPLPQEVSCTCGGMRGTTLSNSSSTWQLKMDVYAVKHVLMATCIQKPPVLWRPLCDVPNVSAPYFYLYSNTSAPTYIGHYEVGLPWPFNPGFTEFQGLIRSKISVKIAHGMTKFD